MVEEKQKTKNKDSFSEVIMSLVGGFIKNLSIDLVLNARDVIREKLELLLEKTKNSLLVAIMGILGLVFLAVGVSILIGSLFREVPGIGFVVTGLVFVLIGWGFSMRRVE